MPTPSVELVATCLTHPDKPAKSFSLSFLLFPLNYWKRRTNARASPKMINLQEHPFKATGSPVWYLCPETSTKATSPWRHKHITTHPITSTAQLGPVLPPKNTEGRINFLTTMLSFSTHASNRRSTPTFCTLSFLTIQCAIQSNQWNKLPEPFAQIKGKRGESKRRNSVQQSQGKLTVVVFFSFLNFG